MHARVVYTGTWGGKSVLFIERCPQLALAQDGVVLRVVWTGNFFPRCWFYEQFNTTELCMFNPY